QMRELRPMAGYEAAMKAYKDHPAIWMIDYIDEPSARDYPYIGEVTAFLKKAVPAGVLPYINLYPNYASVVGNTGAQTRNQLGTATYAEHVEAYRRHVGLDYVCFDFYLYSAKGAARAKKLEAFYANFEDLVKICRAEGKSLWYIPQVNSAIKELWLSENHLRFQAFLAMCYGAEQIDWACWSRLPSGETADMPGLTGWWCNNVLDLSGNRTEQYQKLKVVNAEIRRLGPAYMKYRNVATRREGAFTIGEMVARRGKGRALFVLRSDDPFDEKPLQGEYRFKADGPVKVTANGGAVKAVKNADGTYSIPLKSNAAALIEFTAEGDAGVSAAEWLFNDAKKPFVGAVQGGERGKAFGLEVFTAKGSDMNLCLTVAKKGQHAEAFPFLAIRYRLLSRIGGAAVFFDTDTIGGFTDKAYTPFGVKGDGVWHNLVVDMRTCRNRNYAGELKALRLDIPNPTAEGDRLWLSRVGLFAEAAEAEKFLAAADEREDFLLDTDIAGPHFRAVIPGGTVSAGFDRKAFSLVEGPVPTGEGALAVTCEGEVVPSEVNSRGFAWYVAAKPGKYALARVPSAAVKPLDAKYREHFGCSSPKAKSRDYFAREHLRIAGWTLFQNAQWDRRLVEDFVECGLDCLIGSAFESRLLTAADELGIEVILSPRTSATTHPERHALEFADHPSYVGDYFIDEPGSDSFAQWGEKARRYAAATGKIPFFNLLPMYANAAQLKFGANAAKIEYYDPDPDLFRKYCEAYCDKIDTPYICTDIYPLNWVRGHKTTYRDYVESINVIASVARRRNREFWCCIQPFGWIASKRSPNAAEFRWQVYTMLSFGCRNLMCWRYAGYREGFPALTDANGVRSPTWYEARRVFREVRKFGDLYCTYRNLGAFTVNCTDKTPYLRMTGEYHDFGTISKIVCDEPLLVGCFDSKKDGSKAFTLVNMTELENDREISLKVAVAGGRATVWRRGKPETKVADSTGFIAIDLDGGEGVFVTVP
ncbi:MAG: hypothetical protein MJ240_04625, partial [Kiritimatiellae bacterium]|nr:hypothetical protein [Kiritimatiellia bacterium]